MECSRFVLLSTGVLCIVIKLTYSHDHGTLNKGNLNDSTPVLKSIIDPNATITVDMYNILPEIEEELNKLTKDEFKYFLEKTLLRVKNDYNMILEIYKNLTLEEEEERENSSNSTLIKRVKRTFHKKHHQQCFSCQGGGHQSYPITIPVFLKPSYSGQGGCNSGCGYQRPQCNQCGGRGGYGGYGQQSFSQSSASASAQSSSFG